MIRLLTLIFPPFLLQVHSPIALIISHRFKEEQIIKRWRKGGKGELALHLLHWQIGPLRARYWDNNILVTGVKHLGNKCQIPYNLYVA